MIVLFSIQTDSDEKLSLHRHNQHETSLSLEDDV